MWRRPAIGLIFAVVAACSGSSHAPAARGDGAVDAAPDRVDGTIVSLSDDLGLDRQMRHNIEVVIDRLVAGPGLRARLAEAVELGLRMGEGNLIVAMDSGAAPQGVPDSEAEEPAAPARKRGARAARLADDIYLSARYA